MLLTSGMSKISKKNKSQLVKSTNSWAPAPDSDSVGLEKCFIPDYSGPGGPQTLCTVISSKNKVFQYKGLCTHFLVKERLPVINVLSLKLHQLIKENTSVLAIKK